MGNKKHWAVVAAALVLLVIFLAIGFGVSASSGKVIDTKYYKDYNLIALEHYALAQEKKLALMQPSPAVYITKWPFLYNINWQIRINLRFFYKVLRTLKAS